MGWSMGNATLLSLFSDPTVIPKALYDTIEPYLRSIVMYEPAYLALGYPRPADERWYNPFADPDYTTGDEIYENFHHWVSSYYTHPDIASGKASGISYAKRTDKRTVNAWTEEEKEKYFDKVAAVRSELPAYAPPMQATLKLQTDKALLDAELVASYFPNVKVLYICGTETCSFCMWAYMECLRLYEEAVAHGEKVRPMKFRLIEGGSHFLHYDAPERLLQEVVHGCSDL
ncbi:hypothetical protein DFH06DRAFT_1385377 [Mycena polygramma]|nr:hypothetical protein DFH06DRAFT_1385377 [Mycena polygramma]